jgi:hypothetical protein
MIILVIQYCHHSNPERQKEYDFCLEKNLENKSISTIYHLSEKKDDHQQIPTKFINHPKFKIYHLGKWMTFYDIITFSNQNLNNQIVGTCNLDIFLDDSSNTNWNQIESILNKNCVLCLSRHEYLSSNEFDTNLEEIGYCNCQDAWFWKSPLPINSNIDLNFEIGLLGCDNAFADRLLKMNYIPLNLRDQFKIYHYDLVRHKSGNNFLDVHHNETLKGKKESSYPEEKGQFLLPNINYCDFSLDKLAEKLKFTKFDKYFLMCQMMSQRIKIRNR